MDTSKAERYINSLESLLEGYNNSNHSSISLPLNVAWNDKPTHMKIRENSKSITIHSLRENENLEIIDVVRIKLLSKYLFFKWL